MRVRIEEDYEGELEARGPEAAEALQRALQARLGAATGCTCGHCGAEGHTHARAAALRGFGGDEQLAKALSVRYADGGGKGFRSPAVVEAYTRLASAYQRRLALMVRDLQAEMAGW